MIVVKLQGGLGNQLFQYATARALCLKSHERLLLDQSGYFHQAQGVTPRTYELDHFALCRRDILFRQPTGPALARLVSMFGRLLAKRGLVYREPGLDFQPSFSRLTGPLLLEGYFQSHLYFQHYRSWLLEELSIRDELSPANLQYLGLIRQGASVSLHVRRGDYVSNRDAANFHGSGSMEYYRHAIRLLEGRQMGLRYFIFSDDLPWCRENFSFLPDVHFVDCNTASEAHLDLHLMRHCQYHIIANSSFSWWGAWLSNYSLGSVIYPRQWFAHEPVNYHSRFPGEWQGI